MTNTTKEAYIKLVEEISLNAWPSHKIELYDGWLIRFSHNYTHRTNSVTQVGTSLLPIEEKIHYCEAVYALSLIHILLLYLILHTSFDRSLLPVSGSAALPLILYPLCHTAPGQ